MSRIANIAFWFFCLLVGLLTLRVFPLGIEAAFEGLERQFPYPVTLLTHVFGASIALMVMPFQFWPGLRNSRPSVHRWTGRAYVLAVLLAGVAGIAMSTRSITGVVSGLGFFTLGLIWLLTTGVAVYHAVKRNIAAHRIWMRRSAALTFAAVTLRIYLPLTMVLGLPYDASYDVIAWVAWLPNLLVVLWWEQRSPRKRLVTP
jgi:hypothetical protein